MEEDGLRFSQGVGGPTDNESAGCGSAGRDSPLPLVSTEPHVQPGQIGLKSAGFNSNAALKGRFAMKAEQRERLLERLEHRYDGLLLALAVAFVGMWALPLAIDLPAAVNTLVPATS